LSSPLFLTAPAGDARLFVVEQPGRIRVIKNDQLLDPPYLDISAKLTFGGERGLLGLAFHPNFATNGFFYVYYTDLSGNIQISRYHANPADDFADPSSASPILNIPHPGQSNHNGGMLLFGTDGKLLIGTGDGGGGGDPDGNGQNITALLGKLLRIDVDGASPYAIPPDNPFAAAAGPGTRGEIWALGLRNPWRYSIDRTEGLLYIADVGQNSWEEVDVMPTSAAGVNYGWNVMEGAHCYNASSCNQNGLQLPVIEYDHGQGCSITGGFVYRGSMIPGLQGHYLYSDYCSGFLRSFRYANGAATNTRDWGLSLGSVLSFGEDASGELYVLSGDGVVYKLMPP
jgi:hypothetical protein